MEIRLVSSEGTVFEFPEKILEFSGFLAELPDPYTTVHLSTLQITEASLKLISDFFHYCKYEQEIVEPMAMQSILEAYQLCSNFSFVKNIDLENLLLLALACHKLEIQCLQNLVNARIAEVIRCEDLEEIEEKFSLEIEDDLHLNFYMDQERRWLSC